MAMTLRAFADSDLDALFAWESDPRAVEMAAWPLYGRVASHNAASAKVLARAGFVEVGSDASFAAGVGAEVVERIYRLDR